MEEWQNGHDQPGYHYHQEQERKPVETPGKRFWKMWVLENFSILDKGALLYNRKSVVMQCSLVI